MDRHLRALTIDEVAVAKTAAKRRSAVAETSFLGMTRKVLIAWAAVGANAGKGLPQEIGSGIPHGKRLWRWRAGNQASYGGIDDCAINSRNICYI